MGANNGIRNEGPEHTVHLKAYYIDHTEVSNAQWNPYAIAERQLPNFDPPEHPVVNINWFHADEYCKWLGGRLPTEAEWEKAARGTDRRIYPWGATPDPNRANYLNSGDPFDNGTAPVAYYREGNSDGRSPYGVSDMAGNVWEWIQDEYDSAYYQRSPRDNPVNYELKTHYLHHRTRCTRRIVVQHRLPGTHNSTHRPKIQPPDRYTWIPMRGGSITPISSP